jgi:hypothetical protein
MAISSKPTSGPGVPGIADSRVVPAVFIDRAAANIPQKMQICPNSHFRGIIRHFFGSIVVALDFY